LCRAAAVVAHFDLICQTGIFLGISKNKNIFILIFIRVITLLKIKRTGQIFPNEER
jgi:hypothetical protein